MIWHFSCFCVFHVFLNIHEGMSYETSCLEVYHLYEKYGMVWIMNLGPQKCNSMVDFFPFSDIFLKIDEDLRCKTKRLGIYYFNMKSSD